MFREALLEVRHHPGRVAATVIAIAISIGFLVGISIFVRTQGAAIGKADALWSTGADVVAEPGFASEVRSNAQVTKALESVPGVAAAEPVRQETASLRNGSDATMVTLYDMPAERFRWGDLETGSWPSAPDEVAITRESADKLHLGVGRTLDAGGRSLRVTGLLADVPMSTYQPAFSGNPGSPDGGPVASQWVVDVDPGTTPADVLPALRNALLEVPGVSDDPADDGGAQVRTAEQLRADSASQLTAGTNVTKYLLMVFGVIALLVGTIIISTTFLILLAQRRRQIGLLRAVGASGSQIRRRMLAQALVIGAIGSAAGIVLGILLAVGGTAMTGALGLGLEWPWKDLLVEFLIGVVVTVVAALAPANRATRVAPLEALRPVPTTEQKRKASVVRIVVCSLMAVGGIAMVVKALTTTTSSIGWALGASTLLSLAVLIAAPLYVPGMVRLFGLVLRPLGPTARLSTANAVRNPSRTSLTAVALMLAVGLSVTLQIGIATTRSTVLGLIEEYYPTDLSVSTPMPGQVSGPGSGTAGGSGSASSTTLSRSVIDTVEGLPNVAATVVLKGTDAEARASGERTPVQVLGANPQLEKVSPASTKQLDDSTILVHTDSSDLPTGAKVTLTTKTGSVTLTAVSTRAVANSSQVLVSASSLARLAPAASDQSIWVTMTDRTDMASTLLAAEPLFMSADSLSIGGGAFISGAIELVLKTLLVVMSALLGVAVVIALIGVANTLGLSVLERRRESALLRAMGLQKRQLRLMLLYEALQTGMVGVVVGIVMGTFFGWLGITSIFRTVGQSSAVRLGVDWWWLLGLLAICLGAAALASVLPGRRAAKATPTEALAEE